MWNREITALWLRQAVGCDIEFKPLLAADTYRSITR